MYEILDTIQSPADLKALDLGQLHMLADQIRAFLIESVSATGGHLASNLGVVELTLAIHRTFDLPTDKLVFDVGHQSYVHKLLTGRKAGFATLRREGGLSGFPKTSESVYDSFNTGHSSTSISAALGMARARDLAGEKHHVLALIGDGALTGGLAYEALCDAGRENGNLIVILNDNQMSISGNVGGMSEYLSKIRTKPSYLHAKWSTERVLSKNKAGRVLAKWLRGIKNVAKKMVLPTNIFEEIGFTYLGPVDGHNIQKLESMLWHAKHTPGPVLVHVCTVKGKGYAPAETAPQYFHGVSKFDSENVESVPQNKADYAAAFGEALSGLAQKDARVVAICPAMTLGSGLGEFAVNYKDRFFDVGIAEAHAVTSAAGLAMAGKIPVVSVYSSFLQRAYDQVIHDVAMQNLHVVFAIDRAGVVGADGETHQGVFDMAFLRQIPNMTVLAPTSFADVEAMLRYAVCDFDAPIALRYPRGSAQAQLSMPFVAGKTDSVYSGAAATVVAVGALAAQAMQAYADASAQGMAFDLLVLRQVWPLDVEPIIESVRRTGRLLVVEDGICSGGIGEAVCAALAQNGIRAQIKCRGYDAFVAQAEVASVYRRYGLDAQSICAWVCAEREN